VAGACGQLELRHAVALGVLQGPTELLPISSSAHLALVPRLLRWPYADLEPELRKSFEVSLHVGTALALVIGLRREVADYVRNFSLHNLLTLALSTAPAAVVALRYERVIERKLGDPLPVAVALVTGSIAMALADGRAEGRKREDAGLTDAVVIGLAQSFALAPGVSRNGATLTAARWREFRRRDANVISRQIALPVILGAAGLKGVRLARRRLPPGLARGMAAGAGAAFMSTLVSMRLIEMLERSRSLRPYAIYRTALAGLALAASLRPLERQRPAPSGGGAQPSLRPPAAVQ
jgi:undecaprenyl-diphosphatase